MRKLWHAGEGEHCELIPYARLLAKAPKGHDNDGHREEPVSGRFPGQLNNHPSDPEIPTHKRSEFIPFLGAPSINKIAMDIIIPFLVEIARVSTIFFS